MAAGSIIIDLLMRTGSFETDTKRAEAALKKFQKQAADAGKTIGLAIGAGITAAVVAFDQLVKSVADFKDFEETIGASAESIASLSIAAATAGVSMDSITGATIKLTKGLTGVDDESKAAGAALAALGLNVEEFKRLDPVAQYEAVGKALAGFADGAQKTAVAVALFGKSGAEQLKVFKALEEQGGRQVILTQSQIEAADAYADSQAKAMATLKAYAQVAALQALPAVTALVEGFSEAVKAIVGVDSAGKALTNSNAIGEFAKGAAISIAVVSESLLGLVKLARALAGSFEAVFADAKLAFDLNPASLGFTAGSEGLEAAGAKVVAALDARNKTVQEANQRYVDLWNYNGTQISDAVRKALSNEQKALNAIQQDPKELARRGRGPATLPQLEFDGAVKAAKATKDKTTEADRYIESLEKQIQKTEELTEVERVLDDIVNGRFDGAKAGQANRALALAEEIDRSKQLAEATKKQVEEADRLEDASNRLREAGKSVFDSTRTPAEAYAIELERINTLLQAGAINSDTYARAVAQLQDQFDENTKRIKSIAQSIDTSIEGQFTNAFAGFIDGSLSAGQAFSQFARGVIADLARIAAQDLAKSLFGSGSNGNSGIGSLLASLFGSSGSGTGFGTGSNFGNQDYGAFLATGTNNVPYDGFKAVLHKGEAVVPAKYNPASGGQSGSTIQVINPPGVPLQAQAREEQQPDGSMLKRIVLSVIQEDARNGGPASQSIASTYGLKRQLPRMGR